MYLSLIFTLNLEYNGFLFLCSHIMLVNQYANYAANKRSITCIVIHRESNLLAYVSDFLNINDLFDCNLNYPVTNFSQKFKSHAPLNRFSVDFIENFKKETVFCQ